MSEFSSMVLSTLSGYHKQETMAHTKDRRPINGNQNNIGDSDEYGIISRDHPRCPVIKLKATK